MNPNIALAAQRPQFNALGARREAMQIQNAQAQQQYNALAMQNQQQQMAMQQQALQRDAETRNALRGNQFRTPEELEQAAGVYGQAGDMDTATKLWDRVATLGKRDQDRIKANFDIAGRVAPMMETPEGYASGRQTLIDFDPKWAEQIPEPFTPEISEKLGRMSMSYKDAQAAAQNAAGKTEPFPDDVVRQKQAIAAAGASRNNVDARTFSEKEESKSYGKFLVKDYEGVVEAANNASAELNNLHMLKNIDVDTGAIEPVKAWAGAFALALGVSQETLDKVGLDKIYQAQGFMGIAETLILTKMQAQKGPQTENDAKRIAKTVASLGNTPEAKDFLLDAAIALRQREIEQAEFYEQWRTDKGSFDGARAAWNDWKKRTPLMGTNKNSGLPVFYQSFRDAMREDNPGIGDKEILDYWRKKYG